MPDFINIQAALPSILLWFFCGYLAGSIPFGVLITRLAGQGDIRSIGSGNIGATNVLRTGNKKLAALTLASDMMKGTLVVLIAYQANGPDFAVIAGLAAFLGHLFPVWLGFKGGKGVATYIGILLALSPVAVISFVAIWLAIAFFTRYSSLAALLATLATPLLLRGLEQFQYSELFAVMSVLTWLKHHENIRRLIRGSESKIGRKG